jgi:hypothetical protein
LKTPPKPLVVRPREAWALLGCGHSRGYQLLDRGELESFVDGSARWITVQSIERYIARRLAAPKRKIRKAPHRRLLEARP